jgi:hypothetical protein
MDTTWASLTQRQRKHLTMACSQGLNPKLPTTDMEAIEALEGLGLIHETANKKNRPVWRPTVEGRTLVASRGMVATFMHRRSQYGYTSSSHQAMLSEPEVIV